LLKGSDKFVKEAKVVGDRNMRSAKVAIKMAIKKNDQAAIDSAKKTLRLAREVKEANVKTAEKKKQVIERKHAKKIKSELIKGRIILKSADKKIAVSNKIIRDTKARIEKIKKTGANPTKLVKLTKKVKDALNVKRTAIVSKNTTKQGIMER
jgi:hypothetical protein